MSIITISRGTLSGGRALAAEVAYRLGYDRIDREELAHETNLFGVPAALLEAAMERPPIIRQQLARERDQYLTGMSVALCRRAMKGNIVYNGHSGHMLLPGIPNILRVRVLADMDYRVPSVQRELGMGHNAAVQYIRRVDEHRDRWVRFLYGVDWHDPRHYDLIIDLAQVGINAAADKIVSMVREPGYAFTPAVASLINDLYLASVANFALLTDPRTALAEVKVTARESVVRVICPVKQADRLQSVIEVLGEIDGIREAKCTVADKSILLIQQRFQPNARLFTTLMELAVRQKAAIELMYFSPEGAEQSTPMYVSQEGATAAPGATMQSDGHENIQTEADVVEYPPPELDICQSELEKCRCSGGSSVFFGRLRALLPALQRRARYDMVVLGDLFIDKPEQVRVRLLSEAKTLFAENLSLPVVDGEELQTRYSFGWRDTVRLITTLIAAAAIFILLFKYKSQLIGHLTQVDSTLRRVLAVLIAVALVPAFAYAYGTFTRMLLKLFRVE